MNGARSFIKIVLRTITFDIIKLILNFLRTKSILKNTVLKLVIQVQQDQFAVFGISDVFIWILPNALFRFLHALEEGIFIPFCTI